MNIIENNRTKYIIPISLILYKKSPNTLKIMLKTARGVNIVIIKDKYLIIFT